MNQKKFFILVFIALTNATFAQTEIKPDTVQPTIGMPMPDFELKNLTHYGKKTASLKDFKGKWLFLDFWFTRCTTCINSFHKVNDISKALSGKMNWVMVGMNDHRYNKGIELLYNELSASGKLTMPAAFDSTLVKRWVIGTMPHIYLVDPNGILYGISDGRDMTFERVRALVNGEKIAFVEKDIDRVDFESDRLLTNSRDIVYQSTLVQWNGERQSVSEIDGCYDQDTGKFAWKIAMVPLIELYNNAFFGRGACLMNDPLYDKVSFFPKLEVKDSSVFEYSFGVDMGKGTYNYALSLPRRPGKEQVMKIVQDELHNIFGYDAHVETRAMPVWRLIRTSGKDQLLKTKGGPARGSDGSPAAGFFLRNFSVGVFLENLQHNVPGDGSIKFIDATGIDYKIDADVKGDLTNIESIRKAIQPLGLDLVKGTHPMKVVVITDPAVN